MKLVVPATLGLLLLCGAASAQPSGPFTPAACAGLSNTTLAAAGIGLPTQGMRATAARDVAAAGAIPAHCLVSGEIAPIDRAAPPIRFQVVFPYAWNGKTIGVGGGGFNGFVPPLAPMWSEAGTSSPAIARGYALFASDSGHPDHPATPGDFMANDESLRNYLGDAIKKTHDAALAIVRAAYGKAPERVYFIGGSTGGREALWAAGRWPQDWDGVVSLYPARDLTTQVLGAHTINRAFAAPGAFIAPPKRAILYGAALEACDMLDGAPDRIINDVRGCNARFDPARARYQGKPLRCPGDNDGSDCLSAVQPKALAVMQSPLRFDYPLASGVNEFPGYNAYTSDLGIGTTTQVDQALLFFGLGAIPPASPFKLGMSLHFQYGDAFVRNGWMRDASANSLDFNPLEPGSYAARISELSKVDASDADLSGFAARGGKLLIMHGLADMIVSARFTEAYYERLRRTMGANGVEKFVRFYEIPGLSHGVSNTFMGNWDYLTALENWVERGKDPGDGEIATDMLVKPGRTRPLCRYPAWPRYDGKGDIDAATSFTCVKGRR